MLMIIIIMIVLFSKGKYMKDFCSDRQQTVCSACVEGYFSSQYDLIDRCDKCQSCEQGRTETTAFEKTVLGMSTIKNDKKSQTPLTCCPVVLFLACLQDMLRTVQQPQMQNVHASVVSCALIIYVQSVRKTNVSLGRE